VKGKLTDYYSRWFPLFTSIETYNLTLVEPFPINAHTNVPLSHSKLFNYIKNFVDVLSIVLKNALFLALIKAVKNAFQYPDALVFIFMYYCYGRLEEWVFL
jgi:hypothetical protein